MRLIALFAAAAATVCLAAPVSAQQPARRPAARPPVAPPPAAPPLQLTAAQRAALDAAVQRGRLLAILDRAGQVTTRDLLARLPEPARAEVVGWVAEREGNGLGVTYFAREGAGYAAVYRAQYLGGRVVAPQLFPAGGRPLLSGTAARMAAARVAVDALDHTACGREGFNLFVVEPSGPSDPIEVYEVNPRTTAARIPAGGHVRTTVAADGSVGATARPTGECVDLAIPPVPPRPAAGARPRPLVINARDATLPNELHVFLALWAGRPLVVATGTDRVRLWGVTGEGVGELRP